MFGYRFKLKNLTQFNRLGLPSVAKNFAEFNTLEEVSDFVRTFDDFLILGMGSNIIISKSEIDVPVMKLGKGFDYVRLEEGNVIVCGGAALSRNVSRFALSNSKSNFEFMLGIPGNIGGVLAMNAGCYGSDVNSILHQAKVINPFGKIEILSTDDIGYFYRGNSLPKNYVFVEGSFLCKDCDSKQIHDKMSYIFKSRKSSQPIYSRTCGSLFKNPKGFRAWELIDQAGCRGISVGGASISTMHSNFLVNNGSAVHSDVSEVCGIVSRKVKLTSGLNLELEAIRFPI